MVYPALSLATLSLAALAAASPVGIKSQQPCRGSTHSSLCKIPYSKVRKYIGANDGKPMVSKMIPGVGTKWQCFDPRSSIAP
ncbi:hypothetical protein ColTof4_10559 [Colletotrichum tofieldiae]|nr:hypothetical protein ColTof3_05785 [Colletotrichum tofieldiae]GKT78136.1 hypothetical protein ColTof4_10559 [Colletotrichum tofieldiae]GKT84527.1 hypothetical protein Ct61P_02377 [Colletotrichum tofieldiae]